MIKASDNHAGFTVVELLIAASISIFVFGAAGFGLVTIMRADQREEAENLRRIELNRALDYIADDIRMASSVTAATAYTINPASPSCSVPTRILHLAIPNPNGGAPNNVVYYLSNISGCTGTSSVWLKPGVIKRVENVNSTTIAGGDGSELVDAIATTPASAPTGCSGTGSFYVCINGRVVDVFLRGKPSKFSDPSKPYPEVKTKVFARTAP